MPAEKWRLPLHLHLSALFIAAILLVGGALSWVAYRLSHDMLEANATELIERANQGAVDGIAALLEPANVATSLLAYDALVAARTFPERTARVPVLAEAMSASPAASALYIGYDDGSFFLFRRFTDDAEKALFGAPAEARYIVQSIERSAVAARGRYLFLDIALKTIAEIDQPGYARDYDPRTRSWYREGIAANGLSTSAPYVFHSNRRAGITVARRAANEHAVVGTDILLETLGRDLARLKTTPGTRLALVNEQAQVLAQDDIARLPGIRQVSAGEPVLSLLDEIGVPALRGLRPAIAQAAHDLRYTGRTQADGDIWRVAVSPIHVEGVAPLYLAQASPDRELFALALKLRTTSIALTVLVILAAVPLTWLIAVAISRSLRRLATESQSIRRFEFAAPITLRSWVTEVDTLAQTMGEMKATIRRFLDVSRAVAAEGDFSRLLRLLLRETISASGAAAGALYLVDGKTLVPAAIQDAAGHDVESGSQAPSDPGSDDPVRTAMRSRSVQATPLSDCHASALGVDGLVRDAHARHATAIPLANRKGQDLGAILLLHDMPMDDAHLAYVDALSSASVSSLETRELIASQKRLFQSFIELIAGAIDAKSPYTGGHCARVPELAKMLARAACEQASGPFAGFRLDDEGWEAVHVAAWLHDCGKVTTPEYVVDKATKLETLYDRIHEIRVRFEVLKRDAQIASLEAQLAGTSQAEAEERLQRELHQLDDDFAFIAACNEGGEFMAPARVERLKAIAGRTWMRTLDDRIGLSHEERARKDRVEPEPLPAREPLLADKPEHRFERPAADRLPPDNPWGFRMQVPELLYDKGELHNLSVGRGTLSEEERYKINEHIVQTIKMLSRLPFPKHLREVPEIAAGHHEKMDGTGYPRGLSRGEMSPLARMMAIADIFEALTATDRPYKKGKMLSEAIAIMARMKEEQHIDGELFDLFLRAGVYREYAQRYMRPEQVDPVDVEAYLAQAD
jgi:HD-GYP domain-containing protein (c-di-GMP phosphodiesterase class II)